VRKSAQQGRGQEFKRVGGFTGGGGGGMRRKFGCGKFVSSEGACEGHGCVPSCPFIRAVKRDGP
jgi:hypothetical protein